MTPSVLRYADLRVVASDYYYYCTYSKCVRTAMQAPMASWLIFSLSLVVTPAPATMPKFKPGPLDSPPRCRFDATSSAPTPTPAAGRAQMRAAWCLLQMLAAYVHATRPPVACRRSVLIGGAATAASVVDVSRAAAAVQPAATTARMSREEAVERTLSRVPVFAVANQEGLPYLTESTKEGKRTGSIYLGLREAVALLEAVRVYDANATLAVVPLASIFSTAAKSSAELESQVAASVETSRR